MFVIVLAFLPPYVRCPFHAASGHEYETNGFVSTFEIDALLR
jgi:hypothetical protein